MTIARILAFDDEAAQATALARALDAPLSVIERHRFPDGELRLRLPAALHGTVVLWRSLHRPNEKLVELMIAAPASAAARTQGADSSSGPSSSGSGTRCAAHAPSSPAADTAMPRLPGITASSDAIRCRWGSTVTTVSNACASRRAT